MRQVVKHLLHQSKRLSSSPTATMATRQALKAGSWYEQQPAKLASMLDGFLAAVPETVNDASLPVPGARIIVAPHAGYDYSGPCAAWAYSCLDLSKAKRVFILGPSHTYYLDGCAITSFAQYATPLGNLAVDRETIKQLKHAGHIQDIPTQNDESEHSLEMHLPYLYKCCQKVLGLPDKFPSIVPMLIGDHDLDEEKNVGRMLLPYLKDAANAFIISSDFCHWGSNFRYTAYAADQTLERLVMLNRRDAAPPTRPAIHESIRWIDEAALEAMQSGVHDSFYLNLQQTGNTVCGRHPIGVAMAGLGLLADEANDKTKHRFRVVKYDRSNLVEQVNETSVSYVSAYAVL